MTRFTNLTRVLESYSPTGDHSPSFDACMAFFHPHRQRTRDAHYCAYPPHIAPFTLWSGTSAWRHDMVVQPMLPVRGPTGYAKGDLR